MSPALATILFINTSDELKPNSYITKTHHLTSQFISTFNQKIEWSSKHTSKQGGALKMTISETSGFLKKNETCHKLTTLISSKEAKKKTRQITQIL